MSKRAEAVRRLQLTPQPTRADVARDLGVPVSTVSYWAKVAGIPPGSRGRRQKHAEKALRYQYSAPPAIRTSAFERLADVGIDNVANLLEGLADGTLRISRTS